MNITRLREMQRVLARVPKGHFTMEHWEQGTKRCAIAWAAVDGWFLGDGIGTLLGYDHEKDQTRWPTDWEVACYFDISTEDAGLLFVWYAEDATPETVSKKIDRLIAEGLTQ